MQNPFPQEPVDVAVLTTREDVERAVAVEIKHVRRRAVTLQPDFLRAHRIPTPLEDGSVILGPPMRNVPGGMETKFVGAANTTARFTPVLCARVVG